MFLWLWGFSGSSNSLVVLHAGQVAVSTPFVEQVETVVIVLFEKSCSPFVGISCSSSVPQSAQILIFVPVLPQVGAFVCVHTP